MSKSSALFISSFTVGVLLPVLIVGLTWNRVLSTQTPIETVVEETVDPSEVQLFTVDYNQFGNMFIGETIIRCQIANNAGNNIPCKFYLEDSDGRRITEEYNLNPGGSESVISTTFNSDAKGSYDVMLKYEVLYDGETSIIDCPYTILVNERRS